MRKNHYYEDVYDITKLIPKGRVCTYGNIADYLGLGSARMVGWALNQVSKNDHDIPAHRVVNRKGELSGRVHFNPPSSMQDRLEKDGILVENHQVVNFKNLIWHPREIENE